MGDANGNRLVQNWAGSGSCSIHDAAIPQVPWLYICQECNVQGCLKQGGPLRLGQLGR